MPKKYLVLDDGTLPELALGLTKDGNEVKYYTNYPSTAPEFHEYAAGMGFEGMEKIKYFFDHVESADCIANFDVGLNDQIAFLRKMYPNKSIFGSGNGCKLEDSRWGFKKILKSVGLQVGKAERVMGITALVNCLKDKKDVFVKIDVFRGLVESFYAKDFKSVELLITQIAQKLGPFKDTFQFIVEESIPAKSEIGYDGFFNGEDYVYPCLTGIEMSKNGYIAKVTDEMVSPIKASMDALKPVLQQVDWRGCISTEERIVSQKEHYIIDICARSPSPLGVLYPQFILNWPEVVYKIGLKQEVRLDIAHKYVGTFALTSHHAENEWLELNIDEKDRGNVKLLMAAKNNGRYYAVPGEKKVIVLIAGGGTVDQVITTLKKYAKKVSAYGLHSDEIESIDKIHQEIANAKSVGILI